MMPYDPELLDELEELDALESSSSETIASVLEMAMVA